MRRYVVETVNVTGQVIATRVKRTRWGAEREAGRMEDLARSSTLYRQSCLVAWFNDGALPPLPWSTRIVLEGAT